MTSPLAGLAGIISRAASGVFFDGSLARDARAAGTNDWTPGSTTVTDYACKALVDTWSAYHVTSGLVAAADAKILVLASTLSVEPVVGDRITVRGQTYTIVSDGGSRAAVETDPATAVWVCRGRK